MNGWEIFFTALGMGAITLFCRSSFLLPRDEMPMPRWLREGLAYAPTAALAAVVSPSSS